MLISCVVWDEWVIAQPYFSPLKSKLIIIIL